ncbi:2-amino-3,7-dideoxy-D-threo-hept-6-ulosonate synthase [Actinophytocola oryzae]|uniref:2-amino-3,7-dideoxy-D-threo-hept-6-ulosonate synthase n=1 Tax=Actinophytocola oryzae TaxID=502181 RepID=A0A4R7VW20_9PSEU|nr:2-amino-3,7-dideoxy-D-threo-hept-6-ulosonate synthase [Actinophytocola oryzae]TDV54233.1 2-amino-3,7-dideoxy-D-threo-hept-6-ulosonate synthase [Actinophytocola oryzae]
MTTRSSVLPSGGNPHLPFGARLRLDRLDGRGDGRLAIVPLDHSVSDGPITPDGSLDRLVGRLADARVDAVVVHKGTARTLDPRHFQQTSLIVHLSASTTHAQDPDAKYLVASVESALRLGADAVSVHVNMGSRQEATQVADLARTAELCDRWNLPLLAMMYARGPAIADPSDPELVAHAATLAADLGADLVKVSYPGTEENLAAVVRACPVPVVLAGGPPVADRAALLARVGAMVRAGAAGVAMGRNIFRSPDPGAFARDLVRTVHEVPVAVAA